MLALRRAVGGAVSGLLVLAAVSACGGGSHSTATRRVPLRSTVFGQPAAGTALSSVLSQIRSDGRVPLATALEAFTLAVGPLPGVPAPGGPPGTTLDGSFGVRWVLGYWDQLTAAQQAAVDKYLAPPAQQTALAPAATAQLMAYRPGRPASAPAGVPPAGPYLALAQGASAEIAANIGHPLALSLSVVINATQTGGADVGAYTTPVDSSGGFTGRAARCVIYVEPFLYHMTDTAQVKNAMAHEVFHCFQAMDYPTIPAFGRAPSWLIEGSAEWVGDTIEPVEDGWWDKYLTELEISLFARSYDALGFFAHMAESGLDPWHLLGPMLKASGNTAAYDLGVDGTFRLTWASSLARQPRLGHGWDTTGPGIPAVAYHPAVSVLATGVVLSAKVAPYTNGLVEFNATADVVEVSASTAYSRLHDSGTNDYDRLNRPPRIELCANDCNLCPKMSALPKLAPGAAWLAITGDTTGATYTVSGMKDVCGACLVGDWTATRVTLTSASGSLTGGVGAEVDIAPDGSTQLISSGTVYTSSAGPEQVRVSGTETFRLGFPAITTALSGPLSVSDDNDTGVTVEIDGAVVSGNGGAPELGIGVSGRYDCAGDNLDLHFVSSGKTSGTEDLDLAPKTP